MTTTGWTPALAVGHDGIDLQHEELFRGAGRLVDAMVAGDRTAVSRLFDFLGDRFADHFAAEEQLMRESGFPGYNVHRAAHERFVRDLKALRRLHEESGANSAVAIKARTWILEWLRGHIGSNQRLARHLLAQAG
ncbi:MAG TPA: hemerythrin family protein [Anaeromyxobacter sp.]|nr:hemerythrin family protein [Anaeromyxobacter sp.]